MWDLFLWEKKVDRSKYSVPLVHFSPLLFLQPTTKRQRESERKREQKNKRKDLLENSFLPLSLSLSWALFVSTYQRNVHLTGNYLISMHLWKISSPISSHIISFHQYYIFISSSISTCSSSITNISIMISPVYLFVKRK